MRGGKYRYLKRARDDGDGRDDVLYRYAKDRHHRHDRHGCIQKGLVKVKNVLISKELFIKLIKYHLFEMYEFEDEIKGELEKKLNSIAMREYYTASKTALTEKEREEARKIYLDERGVPESFRW